MNDFRHKVHPPMMGGAIALNPARHLPVGGKPRPVCPVHGELELTYLAGRGAGYRCDCGVAPLAAAAFEPLPWDTGAPRSGRVWWGLWVEDSTMGWAYPHPEHTPLSTAEWEAGVWKAHDVVYASCIRAEGRVVRLPTWNENGYFHLGQFFRDRAMAAAYQLKGCVSSSGFVAERKLRLVSVAEEDLHASTTDYFYSFGDKSLQPPSRHKEPVWGLYNPYDAADERAGWFSREVIEGWLAVYFPNVSRSSLISPYVGVSIDGHIWREVPLRDAMTGTTTVLMDRALAIRIQDDETEYVEVREADFAARVDDGPPAPCSSCGGAWDISTWKCVMCHATYAGSW